MTKTITFIGDVHEKLDGYFSIIEKVREDGFTYCVGDFGFKEHWDMLYANIPIMETRHRINMGNHDYTPYKNQRISTGDFSFDPNTGVFTIRGASSIDKSKRMEGYDWFRDEELNFTESMYALDAYEKHRPDIVVSHDCPENICNLLFGYTDKNHTRKLLQEMLDIHRPKLWVFGHHHKYVTSIYGIDGEERQTKFVCLTELQPLTIQISLTDSGHLSSDFLGGLI